MLENQEIASPALSATAPMGHVPGASTGQSVRQSLVAFQLGDQEYALPVESIVQIIEMVTVTPIPGVNHSVRGVLNYHGKAVPVLDLRLHLGLSKAPLRLDTHIVLVQIGDRKLGLIVDRVTRVLSLADGEIVRPQEIAIEGVVEAPILRGLVQTSNGPVFVFDIIELLWSQQAGALAWPELSQEHDLDTESGNGNGQH
jgi:purine-binding chemotaxis protein CheW